MVNGQGDVDTALARMESGLSEYFDRRVAAASAYGIAYRSLWESMRQASLGGKRLRPRFVLTACRGLGGVQEGADWEAAERVALAYELLHTAFLAHDDLIDGDTVRRGRHNVIGALRADAIERGGTPSQGQRWGEVGAILAGDLLIHDATAMIARTDADRRAKDRLLDILHQGVFVTAAGELADSAFAERFGSEAPSFERVLAMTEWKTADYSFAGPLMSGAVLAGADDDVVAVLAEFGRLVGVAFQLGDDLLGVFGSEEATGKSILGDLREGKETPLIAYAREEARWHEIVDSLGSADLGPEEARRLAAVLEECGARDRVEQLLLQHADRAIATLDASSIPPGLAGPLNDLARSCVGRVA